jgi:hypothetical protein
MRTTLSLFATNLLSLKGKKFSFTGYLPFKEVYDIDCKGIVLKAGRQVGKSVSMAGRMVGESVLKRYFNTLYMTPLSAQAARFSSAYLDPYLKQGLVKKYFQNPGTMNNVFEKSLSTGSRIYLSYGAEESEVDRVRGIMTDAVLVDEVQDMNVDALPVIMETMSSSEHKLERYAGTSKTINNTLEMLWQKSSLNEWVVKCTGCGKYNIPNTFESCMGMCKDERGTCCMHCGTLIDVTTGQWVVGNRGARMAGFHLPQHIFGSRTSAKNWPDLYHKIHGGRYTEAKVANEVFGLAHSSGGRPLVLNDALGCCNPAKKEYDTCRPADTRSILYVALGVDWSVSSSLTSFTIISVLGFDMNHKAYNLYSQRIQGVDILEQVERVKQVYYLYNANGVFMDRGVGVLQGQLLEKDLGTDVVTMMQYVTSKPDARFESVGNFISLDRTRAMGRTLFYMKQGRKFFETPCFEASEDFWKDAFNLVDEETASGKIVFRHDGPDDWFHSITFALAGYEYSVKNAPQIIPSAGDDRGIQPDDNWMDSFFQS